MALRVEYVGFVDTAAGREYSMTVQEGAGERRSFVLVIANEAFASRNARYQDGPDICYQKLVVTLASSPAASAERIALSDEDLWAYRHAHAPRQPRHRVVGSPLAAGGSAEGRPNPRTS
jgi:hypothetical protein